MATTLMEQQLARDQLAQQRLLQEQELAARQQAQAQEAALARQKLAQDAALAQLQAYGQQAELGLTAQDMAERAMTNRMLASAKSEEDALRSREMAIKFGAYQQLQSDLSSGMDYGEALRKNLAGLTIGSPGVIAQTDLLDRPVKPPAPTPGMLFPEVRPGVFAPVADPSYRSPAEILADEARLDLVKAQTEQMKGKDLNRQLADLQKSKGEALIAGFGELEPAVEQFFNNREQEIRAEMARAHSSTSGKITKEEYDKLPSGTAFWSGGKRWVKP